MIVAPRDTQHTFSIPTSQLDPSLIGVRPAIESTVDWGRTDWSLTFPATDSFVQRDLGAEVDSDDTIRGESLFPSVSYIGTRCCFHGKFDNQVGAQLHNATTDDAEVRVLSATNNSVCFDQEYGAHTVKLYRGVEALSNVTIDVPLTEHRSKALRSLSLDATLLSMYKTSNNSILTDTAGLIRYEDENLFHLKGNSSIQLSLPPTTSVFWITGPSGHASLASDRMRVSFSPNISRLDGTWDGTIGGGGGVNADLNGTLFMTPLRVGVAYTVTLSMDEYSDGMNMSNILIYTEDARYTTASATNDKIAGLVNTLTGVAWGVLGLVVVVLIGVLWQTHRQKQQRRIEDCFDICKPDYYDAPATPITPFMFESAKVPQSPSHRVSHSRWSSLSSRYSDSSDYHAAENTIREPLRVVVVDSVLNSSGPTSNTPFDSAAPLLTIPGTPLSPMTPLSPVVRTSRHRQSYALETPDTEVGPTQPLRITKRSTLLSPRSPSQPSPFQSPKSLRTQSYRSRWANPAERSPTP